MAGSDWRDDEGRRIMHKVDRGYSGNREWIKLRKKYNLNEVKEYNKIVEFTYKTFSGFYAFKSRKIRIKGSREWIEEKPDTYLEKLINKLGEKEKMIGKLNFENFREKIGDWDRYLQPLFESADMYNLYQEFKALKNQEVKITPDSKDLYRFLKLCPPSELKVVVIGMDSYPGQYSNGTCHATGVAFDNSNSPNKQCQPSLIAMHDGIAAEYNEEAYYENDLSYLCMQGVMLGNRALNCRLGETGSFMGKWDFFWKYIITEVINNYFPGTIFLLLGKQAWELEVLIDKKHHPVFKLYHPSYAARSKQLWDTKDIFKEINNIIAGNIGKANQIIWNSRVLQGLVASCPF